MNGKKAKKLRKLARSQTQGMPLIQYEAAAIKVMGQSKLTGAILLSLSSTRGHYQQLKRNPTSTQSTGRGVSI